jgi:hypothetical protein
LGVRGGGSEDGAVAQAAQSNVTLASNAADLITVRPRRIVKELLEGLLLAPVFLDLFRVLLGPLGLRLGLFLAILGPLGGHPVFPEVKDEPMGAGQDDRGPQGGNAGRAGPDHRSTPFCATLPVT